MATAASEAIVSILVLAGALFILVGSIGMARFPDVYTRLHAMGLASGLGIALVLLGSVIHFGSRQPALGLTGLVTIVFVFLTFPVITHAIAWAAYHTGVPLGGHTISDEAAPVRTVEKERSMRLRPPADSGP